MPTSISVAYTNERLYALYMERAIPQVAYSICKAKPFLWSLMRRGAFNYDGTMVKVPVVLEESPNVSAIALNETYGTTTQNTPKAAVYTAIAKYRGSFIVDRTELHQANGNPKKLLDTAARVVVETMANRIEQDLYNSNASTPKNVNGLFTALDSEVEANQTDLTVGGIAKNSFSNWRNRFQTMTTFSNDGITAWLRTLMDCAEDGSSIDTILTDPAVWRLYQQAIAAGQERQDQKAGDVGFLNLLFQNVPVFPAPQIPTATDPDPDGTGTPALASGYTFFLNLSGDTSKNVGFKPEDFKTPGKNKAYEGSGGAIQLAVVPGDDFRVEGPLDMPDGDMIKHDMYFTCQMIYSSLKRLGLTKFTGAVQ